MRHLPIPLLSCVLALAACGEPDELTLHGYAEADFRNLAPQAPGRIDSLNVADGDRVAAGTALFSLDSRAEREALEAARRRAEAAAARFDEAAAGGREPEIAAARDALDQAGAEQQRARENLVRTLTLFERGVVARARLDDAEAQAASADARVAELRQRLTLVQLPAREQRLAALAAEAEAARAEASRLEAELARRTVSAPAEGRIDRVLAFEGEMAGPSQPVVRFLPDGALYALVFVPEPILAGTPVGTRLSVTCDACPPDLKARITAISDEAEFTPPVIYSDEERARLVYRAEAVFEGADAPPAGTPLRVRVVE